MINFITNNWKEIADCLARIVAVASIVVKVTPTLKDDSFLLPIVKFLGRYIALNKYSPEERPK